MMDKTAVNDLSPGSQKDTENSPKNVENPPPIAVCTSSQERDASHGRSLCNLLGVDPDEFRASVADFLKDIEITAPRVKATEKEFYDQCFECATLGLNFLNSRSKGVKYELVSVGRSTEVDDLTSDFNIFHANFLAKPKGSQSIPDLYFIELADEDVVECCVLEYDAADLNAHNFAGGVPKFFYHPAGTDCFQCRLLLKPVKEVIIKLARPLECPL